MPRTSAVHAIWDQARARPLAVQLEIADALLDHPQPGHRRMGVQIARAVLRDVEDRKSEHSDFAPEEAPSADVAPSDAEISAAIESWSDKWAQCWNSVSLRLPGDVRELVKQCGHEAVALMRRNRQPADRSKLDEACRATEEMQRDHARAMGEKKHFVERLMAERDRAVEALRGLVEAVDKLLAYGDRQGGDAVLSDEDRAVVDPLRASVTAAKEVLRG